MLDGSWQCFRGDGSGEDLIFRVERTLNTLTRTEFNIFLGGANCEDSTDFKMKGCPFQRSCTIYKGNSIVAQERVAKLWESWVSQVHMAHHHSVSIDSDQFHGLVELRTSLMYKLGKAFVGRCKFRLTIFPGSGDHAVVMALIVIFFDGRRLTYCHLRAFSTLNVNVSQKPESKNPDEVPSHLGKLIHFVEVL
ncbi:Protein LURP-one-related 7 [Vitis vinifera]|uniref:Protein LURP-one-related 7 n=1 Tax=Vitis vinifera TaxID=29760 RepID=A0A438FAC4_VITVI|nr:Protein LURP-one-related 7 [Vitis vinifera]